MPGRQGFVPARLAPTVPKHNDVPSVDVEVEKEAGFDA